MASPTSSPASSTSSPMPSAVLHALRNKVDASNTAAKGKSVDDILAPGNLVRLVIVNSSSRRSNVQAQRQGQDVVPDLSPSSRYGESIGNGAPQAAVAPAAASSRPPSRRDPLDQGRASPDHQAARLCSPTGLRWPHSGR